MNLFVEKFVLHLSCVSQGEMAERGGYVQGIVSVVGTASARHVSGLPRGLIDTFPRATRAINLHDNNANQRSSFMTKPTDSKSTLHEKSWRILLIFGVRQQRN